MSVDRDPDMEQTRAQTSPDVSIGERLDLACDEFENAWKSGGRPQIEDYIAGLPESHQWTMLRELLAVELAYRRRNEEQPQPDEYAQRFPEYAELLPAVFREAARDGYTPNKLGDYELVEKLGQGGMGVVWKARHVRLKKVVAVKVLPGKFLEDERALSRFHREMALIGQLDHVNIVRAHDAREESDVHFLVMEYVDGDDLDRVVRQHHPLPVDAACEIIRQAADGLQHAHESGLVHRDIKPSNLMINDRGVVKLLDLGLARFHDDEHHTRQLTQTGFAMGTVDYMAPEQWEDSSGVDIRADIYSLGCTLFFALTGKVPYGGAQYSSVRKKLMAHQVAAPPKLSEYRDDVPPELEAVLHCMLAKEPAQRYAEPYDAAMSLRPFCNIDTLTQLVAKGGTAPRSSSDPTQRLGSSDSSRNRTVASLHGRDTSPLVSRGSNSLSALMKKKVWVYGAAATLAAVLVTAMVVWLLQPVTLSEQQIRRIEGDVAAMPGLYGGWWFDETPHWVPGLRAELIDQVRVHQTVKIADRDEKLSVDLRRLADQSRTMGVDELYEEVRTLSKLLTRGLPDREKLYVVQIMDLDPEESTYEADLAKMADKLKFQLDAENAQPKATELHLCAVLFHRSGDNETASSFYQRAIDQYKEDDATKPNGCKELLALCYFDWARMLQDYRQYNDASARLHFAAEQIQATAIDAPALLASIRGERAYAKSKIPNHQDAIREAQDALDVDGIPNDHPLLGQLFSRQAVVYLGAWQPREADLAFEKAIQRRLESGSGSKRGAAHLILYDRLGRAMAQHFAGQDVAARKTFRELIDAIERKSREQRRLEDEFRRPETNAYGSWSDCYLLEGSRDLKEASRLIEAAIDAARDQGFADDHRLPYLYNLQFKLCVVQTLDGQDSAQSLFDDTQTKVAQAMKDKRLTAAQEGVYIVSRTLAQFLLAATAADDEHSVDPDPLMKLIDQIVDDNRVTRSNIDMMLLAIEQLIEKGSLSGVQLTELSRMLREGTFQPRDYGGGQVSDYLRPHFVRMEKALAAKGETAEREKVKNLLDDMQ